MESAGSAVDTYETPFGIRTVRFDAERDSSSTASVKLKGTCNHQDHAGVGAALPDRLQYYRIERLKEWVRMRIAPRTILPTPELVDACDQLGMMMMCETRLMDSTPEALSQLERMVRCHRNHPSIVIWSVGNEEPEQGTERGARIEATMKRVVKANDDSRLITQAMNYGWGRQGRHESQDVQGFNYNEGRIDAFHKDGPRYRWWGRKPPAPFRLAEFIPTTRKGLLRAYDLEHPPWAQLAEFWWKFYDSVHFWRVDLRGRGSIIAASPLPTAGLASIPISALWTSAAFPRTIFTITRLGGVQRTFLHLFPHWNWEGKQGEEIQVWVHSNLDRVELFLNGQSQGAQNVSRNTHLVWKVKYAPGAIEARGI